MDIESRVLRNGKPLDRALYNWDEAARTLHTKEIMLVIDFTGYSGYTFNTGSGCTFNTRYGCTFKTGSGCTFKTGSDCIFKTDSGCMFKTSYVCTFNTGYGCTFKTDSGCTFNTGYGCTFETGSDCTFKTGSGCTLLFPPIHFNGSQYFIEFSKPGHIRSGCIEKPVSWWEENIVRCAEEHNYTTEQIKEYQLYVKFIAEWMKSNGLYEVSPDGQKVAGA